MAPLDGEHCSERAGGGRLKVCVTGSAGVIGKRLVEDLRRDHDVVTVDVRDAEHIVDVGVDLAGLQRAFTGCETVVHLAAPSDSESPWEIVYRDGIGGTYNAFEAARRAGVKQMIYPSSNHAVGEYEVEAPKPDLYQPGFGLVLDDRSAVRPDGYYGIGKVFGEAMGRFYSDRYGMQVACLRICSVTSADKPIDPIARPPWKYLPLTDEQRALRLLAMWCSQRDFGRLVRAIMSRDVRFAIINVVGDNPTRWFDLERGRAHYGWWPLDGSAS
ncbi:MAG TPA: NAD(P)-dependent oxidoreductase [Candidatus Binatia bacterium]|nr:NAD(P)-dependent oxidoreductase [Candidatus Binatia bacterium]